jgi:cation diffusion facilitator family transporter
MSTAHQNYKFQKGIATVAVALFIIKIIAWYLTNSISILTDALESTINVISAFIGLYSLYLSAQPKDQNHPYGHGKVEFLSAAFEGTLITVAGLVIIYEAMIHLRHPEEIGNLDSGIILISITAIINFGFGFWAVKKGEKNNSLALIASGKHLQSDTYSTAGIIIGLFLITFTKALWLDSAVALVFALFIMYTGYKIIRNSIAGIMDEADEKLLQRVVMLLQNSRRENWIDMHNLRIIKYGSTLHLDCHITVPWYFNALQIHDEIEELTKLVQDNFGESVELFVHPDACLEFSCKICGKHNCAERKAEFKRRVDWTVENISSNTKHRID